MGKSKQSSGISIPPQTLHSLQNNYGLDQNFKKSQNNNIVDLVTHKEKQIQKRKYKLGTKQKKDGESSSSCGQENVYEFQDEGENGQRAHRYNRYERRQDSLDKQKLLQSINRLMAKNKINSKTAFDIPILSVQDFVMQDQSIQGDFAWNKMSSILENDYKIYGIRVDSILQFIHKISSSLGRKEMQTNQSKQKQDEDKEEKNEKKNNEKLQKISQLMTTESKNDLTVNLEKNSQNLDINLRTKLMMRKDPLFQRTSRKFDHSSYSSFFMNTLSLSNSLFMQINATDENQQTNPNQLKQKPHTQKQITNNVENGVNNGIQSLQDNTQMIDEAQQRQTAQKQISLVNQKEVKEQKLKQLILSTSSGQRTMHIKLTKQFQKLETKLEKSGVTLYDEGLKQEEAKSNYEQDVTRLLKGKFKYVFQQNMYNEYESSEEIPTQKNNIQINHSKPTIYVEDQEAKTDNRLNNIDKNVIEAGDEQKKQNIRNQLQQKQQTQSQKDDQKQQNQQNSSNQEHPLLDKNNNQKPKTHKIQKRVRKIKQVITMNQPKEKKNITGPRKRKTNSIGIKSIANQQKKQLKSIKKEEKDRDIFLSEKQLRFKNVLRKQRILPKQENIFDSLLDKNLLQPLIQCGFRKNVQTELVPFKTLEDIRRQKQKLRQLKQLQLLKQCQKANLTQKMLDGHFLSHERIKQQEQHEMKQQQEEQNTIFYKKQPTITNVKKNIYYIIKQLKGTDFKNLCKIYRNQHENLSPATIFIALLHLTNQRYVKVAQMGRRNFKIQIFDM